MNLTDIPNLRLINQQVASTKFKTAKEIVGWMGAMQAQDFNMAKWAVGVRLPGSTDQLIASAFDKGEILRTHLMRPTWHFVSSDDIYWMLELTAPQIRVSLKARDKVLEIDQRIYSKSNAVIENALRGGEHLTRDEIVDILENAGIATDIYRITHYLLRAELDGIICSGRTKNNKQTHALLAERAPLTKALNHDEALAKLARRYFTSHSPATLHDFIWWSGLPATKARHALELVKSDFVAETIGQQTYWLTNAFSIPKSYDDSVHLLPAFDEFIISYKDRTATLSSTNHLRAVSTNGIFRPVVVMDGLVAGIWKRSFKKEKVILETELFEPADPKTRKRIEKGFIPFGNFINKEIEIAVPHLLKTGTK